MEEELQMAALSLAEPLVDSEMVQAEMAVSETAQSQMAPATGSRSAA